MQKKMSKGMLMATLICGSLSVLNVASAEEMQTFEMDEFVVTASRVATSKVDTPANISVISAEEIADKNYNIDLCGYPHEEEEILPPKELIQQYQAKRASLNADIDRILAQITDILGIDITEE